MVSTARTAVLPTEALETYQRHIQQFLDEYAPATPTETQLVHEIANTAGAWSAASSPKPPKSSTAISAKNFPGSRSGSRATMASFFQKNKSSATHEL